MDASSNAMTWCFGLMFAIWLLSRPRSEDVVARTETAPRGTPVRSRAGRSGPTVLYLRKVEESKRAAQKAASCSYRHDRSRDASLPCVNSGLQTGTRLHHYRGTGTVLSFDKMQLPVLFEASKRSSRN